jgi:hypothetical protein
MRAACCNAAQFLAAVQAFNGALGANSREILHSRWPGSYPEAMSRRWFAAMPLRPGQDLACAALQALVTVDLTGLNPNVCLELGMAHALGRPTLSIGERGSLKTALKAALRDGALRSPLSAASRLALPFVN